MRVEVVIGNTTYGCRGRHVIGTSVLTALACVIPLGLGTVDLHAVAALGLPKSAVAKPDAVMKVSSPAEETTKPAGNEAKRFSMGVTLPTVPTRLIKRILSGEYMDMGELSQEALLAEFKRATEGEDQRSSKSRSFRPVVDRDAWAASFAQYAGVVCHSHPEKAVALWGHLAVIMSCQNRTNSGWWRTYDESLRHSYSSMEEATFAMNQCLFTQAMVENSEAIQRATPPGSMPPSIPPKGRKKRVQACFAWNDCRPCASVPCRFSDCCARCGGEHARRFCPPTADTPSGEDSRRGLN